MYPISILLPVYNGLKYLEKSVLSILNQENINFEFLIIDDCSTDGSWEYLLTLSDKKIKLFRNTENKGLFYNLNFLIRKSNAPIIKLWSQDDILYVNCLKKVVDFHHQYPNIGFSYTGRDYIDGEGNEVHNSKIDDTPEIISSALHARIAFFTGSIAGNIANVAINKFALEKVGLFNEQMKISGDFEMWVRLAKEHTIGFIREPLLQLRNHKDQLSGQEKYYIFHLKEDIEAYNLLFGCVNEDQLKQGKLLLRNYKLLFYYTLMLKALLKGKIKIALNFCLMLHQFDNIFLLTCSFIKNKLFSNKTNNADTNKFLFKNDDIFIQINAQAQ